MKMQRTPPPTPLMVRCRVMDTRTAQEKERRIPRERFWEQAKLDPNWPDWALDNAIDAARICRCSYKSIPTFVTQWRSLRDMPDGYEIFCRGRKKEIALLSGAHKQPPLASERAEPASSPARRVLHCEQCAAPSMTAIMHAGLRLQRVPGTKYDEWVRGLERWILDPANVNA